MTISGTDQTGKSDRELRDESGALRDKPLSGTPGGFKNDPDDASNPNEAIDRTRRTSLNPKAPIRPGRGRHAR